MAQFASTQLATDDQRTLHDRLGALLSACRQETVAGLVDSARIRRLRPGELIYGQGAPVPLTLILEGYGIARRTTADGQQFLSGVATSGNLFGYSGVAASISTVEIVALTDCLVAQWAGGEIRELIATDSALAVAAIDALAGSLHALMEQIEGFLHQDARRRVLRILARHRALFFCDPPVLNRAHLAGLVGTTQEMTRRVLRQLEREGAVARVGRSGLTLLRPDLLEAAAA
jgi:CRP-like cAMP-binding protein